MQQQDESSPGAADDSETHENGDVPSSHPVAEPAVDGDPAEETSEPQDGPTGDDELPEWEPLTPELVEDEAIRGDFMLRWAVILLALMMGWTITQETSVLTHIKTGQYLASNGFLPPAKDVFSVSAGDRPWVNLSWGWDLLVAGAYGISGAMGLTILKALLAALTFWVLSRISVPELPTWWSSVCAALALVAAFPSLNATPAIMTLLGMACLMWLLYTWSLKPANRWLWLVVLLMGVWCQFDDRAWIGAVTLISFLIGHWIDCRRNRAEADARSTGTKALALATAGSLMAMLVHPFVWETLLSPMGLYQLEYPTLQQYASRDVFYLYEVYPLWSGEFWGDFNYFNAAGMLLWLMALVTFVLNRKRLQYSQVVIFAVLSVIASAGGRELAVAGIVNAALAGLNAQQWYLASFRQSYSVETSELLFSRGGRALTVIAFFALGLMMVSGYLTGSSGRRIGMGFGPQLEQTIQSYQQVLEDSFDDRAFNYWLFQGDILNWTGQRSFIDSRVRLFAAGTPSIVDEQLALRPVLRTVSEESEAAENRLRWQSAFDKYGITHVLPRLSGNQPDYTSLRDLNQSPDWTLTRLGAATAVFYRADSSEAEFQEYVAENDATDFVGNILRSREDLPPPVQRIEWPRPPTIYERYFYQPNPWTPNGLQEGRLYSLLAPEGVIEPTTGNVVATAYAAIRKIHQGLAEAPSDPTAYHVLGEVYATLEQLEEFAMRDSGFTPTKTLRNFQIISAYHHALQCNPQDVYAHYKLVTIYLREQRQDLALHHLQQIQKILGQLSLYPKDDPRFQVEQERNSQLMLLLTADLAEVKRNLERELAAGGDRVVLAQQLMQAGYLLTAIETLEEDLTLISGDPVMMFLFGQLFLEAGRTREGHDQVQSLKTSADQGLIENWHAVAALSQVIAEDLTGALATMEEAHRQLDVSAAMILARTAPLRANGPNGPADNGHQTDPILNVLLQTGASSLYFNDLLPRIEDNELLQALINLELGDNGAAEQLFRDLLERDPATDYRPLAEMYLSLLTDGSDLPPAPEDADADTVVPNLFDDEPKTPDAAGAEAAPTGPSSKDDTESEKPRAVHSNS